MTSESNALRRWVVAELVEGLVLSSEMAERVADANRTTVHEPGYADGLVSIARAVKSLPTAREWWYGNEERAMEWLLKGEPDNVL
jgi:hypothetical protein